MVRRVVRALLGASAFLLMAAEVDAQAVLIHGRVEDAVTREALAGVRVVSADSLTSVLTDSLGAFTLQMRPGGTLMVRAERFGYQSQQFDLGEDATSRLSILLLELEPMALEGITATGESVTSVAVRNLSRRRNAYSGANVVFDRVQLERIAPFGSVWDFLRRSAARVFECDTASSGLCTRDRGRRSPVQVCVDGSESTGAVAQLSSMDIQAVALIEIYGRGRGGIRVYTPWYIVTSAHKGRNIATPLVFGC